MFFQFFVLKEGIIYDLVICFVKMEELIGGIRIIIRN